MTQVDVLAAGWLVAILAGVAVAVAWRAHLARAEAIARACHELRGPLTAASLGLQLGIRRGELSSASLRAIDLELARAALALEDLTPTAVAAAPPRVVQEVDVRDLL